MLLLILITIHGENMSLWAVWTQPGKRNIIHKHDCHSVAGTIQDFDTIVSSIISLEMESLKICKESLISMEIDTFDRLRSGLNSFHRENSVVN